MYFAFREVFLIVSWQAKKQAKNLAGEKTGEEMFDANSSPRLGESRRKLSKEFQRRLKQEEEGEDSRKIASEIFIAEQKKVSDTPSKNKENILPPKFFSLFRYNLQG